MHKKRIGKIHLITIISFLITASLCAVLVTISVINRGYVEKLEMEQVIIEKSVKINEVISKLLYKTEALSALVIQSDGNSIDNFEKVAATIIDDPSILNIIIAPNGVVADVYPLKGNEAVIGLDFLSEGAGNAEAIQAKETGELVFGGPFELEQGGMALVGRLPIYETSENGSEKFWGIVSVTLKYPEALEGAALDILEKQGFAYEIWRISPDTGERQVIAQSISEYSNNARFIEKNIPILNANWYFKVAPVRMWYQYIDTWLLIIAGLFISLLVSFVIQNNIDLRIMKDSIELLAHTDPLTGIYNRRFFMENAIVMINRSLRFESDSFIIMFDLDYFKNLNDTYGHLLGDEILKLVCNKVKYEIRPYDLFARYGGEEFILLVSDISEEDVRVLTERLRKCISDAFMDFKDSKINISASFGIAKYIAGQNIEITINNADKALYNAKKEGRNKVVYYS